MALPTDTRKAYRVVDSQLLDDDGRTYVQLTLVRIHDESNPARGRLPDTLIIRCDNIEAGALLQREASRMIVGYDN